MSERRVVRTELDEWALTSHNRTSRKFDEHISGSRISL